MQQAFAGQHGEAQPDPEVHLAMRVRRSLEVMAILGVSEALFGSVGQLQSWNGCLTTADL